jgi:hypothetical protein
MAVRNEYTETVRDLQALIKKEQDAARREALGSDLIRMEKELQTQRADVVTMAVLEERVKGLTKLVWGLLVVIVLELGWPMLKGALK